MCKIDENLKKQVWDKARIIEGYDPNLYRHDACGAWIAFEDYKNRDSIYGWEVDHIYPESKLKKSNVPTEVIDNIKNLRPLNWKNNLSKSDDYPSYRAVCEASGNINIDIEKEFIINQEVRKIIEELYKEYNI